MPPAREPVLSASAVLSEVPLPGERPPIVLLAFARPDLLRQVLVALEGQTVQPGKVLAFVDGPRSAGEASAVRACIGQLERFGAAETEIVARPANLGCDTNAVAAITATLMQHPMIVYLEDDIVPAPFFYERMCRLLERFRREPSIASVSAYSGLPAAVSAAAARVDFCVSRRVFPWGFGTYADRWKALDMEALTSAGNPFGSFARIPATCETIRTILNQFYLEKLGQRDWMISYTLQCLDRDWRHVVPRHSFARHAGCGHPASKTYRGPEAAWFNAAYREDRAPDVLPGTLELHPEQARELDGGDVATTLAGRSPGVWLSPGDALALWRRCRSLRARARVARVFLGRSGIAARRWWAGAAV